MNKNLILSITRWVTRVIGFISCAFFTAFFVGEGGLTEFNIVLLPTIFMIGIAILGYIISWFSEKSGGILMIIGGVAQGIYLLLLGGLSDIDAALIYALPFCVPGLIFVACWKIRKKVITINR